MPKWVSFEQLRREVLIEDVLRHYGILERLRKRRNELVGLCPFHEETKPSFSASTSKNAFICFACSARGGVLEFVAAMEGVSVRQAGLLVADWFQVGSEAPANGPQRASKPQGPPERGLLENKPLTFELQHVDYEHAYLRERRLTHETAKLFEVGLYSGKGLMAGRVVIPVHDESGRLVAYCGRWPGKPPKDEPKYRFPPDFRKSLVLFNLHRVDRELAKGKGLVVTEGFFDAMRIWQAGFRNVVALMGTVLSARQKELLLDRLGPRGKLTLLFDADDAGRSCQTKCLEELTPDVFVKAVQLPKDVMQPDELQDGQIAELLGT